MTEPKRKSIPSYHLVESEMSSQSDIESFEDEIDSLMSEGWKPLGGPVIRKGTYRGDIIYQALVCNENSTPHPIDVKEEI